MCFLNLVNAPEVAENEADENGTLKLKLNTDLRGKATAILLRNLPTLINFGSFKSSLPFRTKAVQLFKKSGRRNALISFSTATECSAAFDALQNFVFEGHSVIFSLNISCLKSYWFLLSRHHFLVLCISRLLQRS